MTRGLPQAEDDAKTTQSMWKMDLSTIHQQVGGWLDNSGPLCDIVISSRIRLARNVSGYLFHGHADEEQHTEVYKLICDRIMSTQLKEDLCCVDLCDIPELSRQLLRERHLVSQRLADGEGARGVALATDESLSLMINEEDHLRVQVLASGLQLMEQYDRIERIDDMIEQQLQFAFSPEYGYLTACPTNVGTGIRVSVMLHLPALKMAGQIQKVFRAAQDMRLAVRGLFGEGSEPVGDFYQLSNQTTLGKSEKQIINELVGNAVEPVVRYERRARDELLKQRGNVMVDKVFRALGVLRHARLISSEETMYMLSYVRLGINLGRITDVTIDQVNTLFQLTQPAHLQALHGKRLDAPDRDAARADLIRKTLS